MERVFALVLILNLTGALRVFGPLAGVEIARVSQILLLLQCLYPLFHQNLAKQLLATRLVRYACFLFLIWPWATALYAPEPTIRSLGLQAYYTTLMFGTAIFVCRHGWSQFRRILQVSLGITILGLVWSVLDPSIFIEINRVISPEQGPQAQSIYEQNQRPYGFFMQPNSAVMGVVLLSLAIVPRLKKWKDPEMLGYLLFVMTVATFTTSRGGILGALLCCLTIYLSHSKWKESRVTSNLLAFQLGKAFLLILVLSLMFVISLPFIQDVFSGTPIGQLSNKMTYWNRIDSLQEVSNDKSLQFRLKSQKRHLNKVLTERPIIGFGIMSDVYYRNLGILQKSSHNALVIVMFRYGIFYLVTLAFFFVFLVKNTPNYVRQKLQLDFALVFSLYLFIESFHTGRVASFRPVFSILGAVVALAVYPGIVKLDVEGEYESFF